MSYLKLNCPDLHLADVDYGKPLYQVFELFARSIIAATGSLWVLELVNSVPISEGTDSSDMIPSWAIDLRDPRFVASPASHERKVDPPDNPLWMFSKPFGSGRLQILAKKIGRVVRVTTRMPWWNPKSSEGYLAEEMDPARTECLCEWTAFATSLDLDDDLVAGPPYRLLKSRKANIDKWEYIHKSVTTTKACI